MSVTRTSKAVNRVFHSMRDGQSDGVESVRAIFHVLSVEPQNQFGSEKTVSCDKRTCTYFRRKHFHHWKKKVFPSFEPQQTDCLLHRCRCFRLTAFTHVHKLGAACLRDIFARNFNLCGFSPGSDGAGQCRPQPIVLTPAMPALTIRASSIQTR